LTGQFKSPLEEDIQRNGGYIQRGDQKQRKTPLWFAYYGMANKAHEFDIFEKDDGENIFIFLCLF